MKRRLVYDIDDLKSDIELLAERATIFLFQSIKNIIGLGEPTPSDTVSVLQFSAYPELWNELKKDEDFWAAVIKSLGLVSYGARDNKGSPLFGLDQMDQALGHGWTGQVIEAMNLTEKTPEERLLLSRRAFYEFMRWYDSEADFNFLVLYAYYLGSQPPCRLGDPCPLVPLEKTRTHKAAPPIVLRPVMVDPFIPTPTQVPTSTTTATSTTTTVVTRPLEPVRVEEYLLMTTLKVVKAKGSQRLFLFYVTKAQAFSFVIRQANRTREVVTVGLITQVLKFFYNNTIILVISGANDNKLIRFNYDHDDIPIPTVVDYFSLTGDWDDLTYVRVDRPTRYATNRKSTAQFSNTELIDLMALSVAAPQNVRPIATLTEEENRRLRTQKLQEARGRERLLTNEEQEVLARIRNRITTPDTRFSDLTDNEIAMMRQMTNYLIIQSDYDYTGIVSTLEPPLVPAYVSNQAAYANGESELLAIKILSVPGETSTDVLHVAVLSRYHFGQGGRYRVNMRIFRYTRNLRTGIYTAVSQWLFQDMDNVHPDYAMVLTEQERAHLRLLRRAINVPSNTTFGTLTIQEIEVIRPPIYLLHRDTETHNYSVKEFSVIFHPARRDPANNPVQFIYVQVIEQEETLGGSERRLLTANSVDLYFVHNQVQPQMGVVIPQAQHYITNYAFFQEVKARGYRLYDYRREKLLDATMRFHCIFYKYYYESGLTKLLFYRESEERGAQPRVGDVVLGKLPPMSIVTISPMHLFENLCYVSFGYEMPRIDLPTRLFKIRIKEGLSLLPYRADDFDLSAALETGLTMKGVHCTYCGEETNNKDSVSGQVYCDTLCQYLFCKTLAL